MSLTEGLGALATERQRLTEERAIALIASPEVRAATARSLAHFRADRNAAQPDQDELIVQSVDAHYFHAALMAVSETPEDPAFIWALAAPHRWMGLDVPTSRFGQDNTDNCYRLASIDEAYRYRIDGRFMSDQRPDFSLCSVVGQLGENILADTRHVIATDQIDVDDEGRFAILLDSEPTDGCRNHLCIAGTKVLLGRDTLGDWANELPCELTITCLSGPPPRSFDAAVSAARAAQMGEAMCSFMLETLQHGMFERGPLNAMMPPWSAGDNGGLPTQASSLGHYRLEPGEAMIIAASRHDARYMGMQITDIWMLSYNYWDRTSSLNHSQVQTDSDGKVRWVISARDPGVANWLDSGGHRHGTILLRWQHLPAGTALGPDAVEFKVVPVDALADHLPADTVWFDARQREQQRARTHRDYNRRIGG